MKNKNSKNFLALLLVITIALSMLPGIALAEEKTDSANVSTKEEFESALDNTSIVNINVTADIDMTGAGVLDISGRTIELGGNTLSCDNMSLIFQGTDFILKNGSFSVNKNGSYALFIGDEGITNNVLVENIEALGGVNIYNATNVTLRNMNVTGTNYYAVWCDENAHAVIESGTYQSNGNAVLGLSLLSETDETGSTLKINGGTFNTNGKPLVLEGENRCKPEISGGIFDAPVDSKYLSEKYSITVKDENGEETIVCNHPNTETLNAKAPTCTENGYTGDIYCAHCGQLIQSGTSIEAAGHNWDAKWSFDSSKHWHECTVDGERSEEAVHSFKWIVDEEATETKNGSKHEECEICGYKKDSVEIPATSVEQKPAKPNTDANVGTENSPKTGDFSNAALWIVFMMLAALGLTRMVIAAKRQKR